MSAKSHDELGTLDNIAGAFNSFYNDFVLRDLLAKIVPGALVIVSLWLVVPRAKFEILPLSDVPWAVWIIFYGAAWLVGIAIQSLGETTGLIQYYPKTRWYDRLQKSHSRNTWFGVRSDLAKMTDVTAIRRRLVDITFDDDKEWTDFWSTIYRNNTRAMHKQIERMVIIKEACGNGFVACLIALALRFVALWQIADGHSLFQFATIVELMSVGALVLLLRRMHREHVKRQFRMMIGSTNETTFKHEGI